MVGRGSEEKNGIAVVKIGGERGLLLPEKSRAILHSIWCLKNDRNGPICGCENGK